MKTLFSTMIAVALVFSVNVKADHHGEHEHEGPEGPHVELTGQDALIVERIIMLADAVEALDTHLHDIGKEPKTVSVHNLEDIVLDMVGLFEADPDPRIVSTEMKELFNDVIGVIRGVAGPGDPASPQTSRLLDGVLNAYHGVFFAVYPRGFCAGKYSCY